MAHVSCPELVEKSGKFIDKKTLVFINEKENHLNFLICYICECEMVVLQLPRYSYQTRDQLTNY